MKLDKNNLVMWCKAITPAIVVWAALFVVFSMAGCAGVKVSEMTVPERIEAAALLIETASNAIEKNTCGDFVDINEGGIIARVCATPAETPLYPNDAVKIHRIVERANEGLQHTRRIPVDGVGNCFGESRTQIACLGSVNGLLAEVAAIMVEKGVK